MDLAKKLNVMSGGIPSVTVFSSRTRETVGIMRGAPLPLEALTAALDAQLDGLDAGANGWLAKR
jgi:hypothetical protein